MYVFIFLSLATLSFNLSFYVCFSMPIEPQSGKGSKVGGLRTFFGSALIREALDRLILVDTGLLRDTAYPRVYIRPQLATHEFTNRIPNSSQPIKKHVHAKKQ